MEEERLRWAEEFLQEAVYRSRERQAAGVEPARQGSLGPGAGCGLGERAAVVLELSPQAIELAARLWPGRDARAGELAQRLAPVVSGWVELQDELDRKRNHFLKHFRAQHGFDRQGYAPATLNELEAGLARVNAEVDAERRRAAHELVGA